MVFGVEPWSGRFIDIFMRILRVAKHGFAVFQEMDIYVIYNRIYIRHSDIFGTAKKI